MTYILKMNTMFLFFMTPHTRSLETQLMPMEARSEPFRQEAILKRGLVHFILGCMPPFRQLVVDDTLITGLDSLIKKHGDLLDNPYVFTGEHNDYNDGFLVFPLWHSLPGQPLIATPLRKDYIPKSWPLNTQGNALLNAVLKKAGAIFIAREVDATGEVSEIARDINATAAQEILAGFYHNIRLIVAPQGTTKSDGTIARVKRGIADYTRLVYTQADAKLPVFVFAARYDFLSGEELHPLVRRVHNLFFTEKKYRRRKRRFFAHFVEDPLYNQDYQDERGYKLRDAIPDAMLDNRYITVSDLASVFVYDFLGIQSGTFRFDDLYQAVSGMTSALVAVEWKHIDPDLLDPENRRERLQNFCDITRDLDYLVSAGQSHILNPDVITKDPFEVYGDQTKEERKTALAHYKETNILLWTYHGIQQLALEREHVGNALKTAGFEVTGQYSTKTLAAQRVDV
jgi:hypothetical protein